MVGRVGRGQDDGSRSTCGSLAVGRRSAGRWRGVWHDDRHSSCQRAGRCWRTARRRAGAAVHLRRVRRLPDGRTQHSGFYHLQLARGHRRRRCASWRSWTAAPMLAPAASPSTRRCPSPWSRARLTLPSADAISVSISRCSSVFFASLCALRELGANQSALRPPRGHRTHCSSHDVREGP